MLFTSDNKKGYGFVEVLSALVILLIFVGIGFLALQSAGKNSRDSKRLQDLEKIQIALNTYFNGTGNGSYPIQREFACLNASSISVIVSNPNSVLSSLPSDPLVVRSTVPAGCYAYRSDGEDFKIMAALENNNELMQKGDKGAISNRYEIFTEKAAAWTISN